MEYGFSKTVDLPYEKAIDKVTEELRKEEFGVLTSIDVRDTLKQKLNVDFKKYIILGACNPSFAHNALQIETQIGLVLPCNIIVYEENGKTVIAAFDPMVMLSVTGNEAIRPVAEKVKERLERVIAAI